MKLHVHPDVTLGQLQDEFIAAFPNLKLVFFSKPHEAYKGSPAKYMITKREAALKEISPKVSENAELYVEEDMPVWQVERLFELEYGLHVQVFRRSGNTWLETSVSDDLTLEQQEAKAKASLRHHFEFVDPMDYREQD